MRIGTAGKSVQFRGVIAGFAALLILPITVFGANIATADSVWVQSYERGSASEACVAQPGETPWQASWGEDSSWKPSWELWANAGKGGWTCARSIIWARDSAATCPLGDIGPGGGLVFLCFGGKTYEMAPKTWNGSASDPALEWSGNTTDLLAGTSAAVGTGAANTAAMIAQPFGGSTSGKAATSAVAYRGGGFSDWFLPSEDELMAMCNYSRNPVAPAAPSVDCNLGTTTSQDTAFASSAYGFESVVNDGRTWSSTQATGSATQAFRVKFGNGDFGNGAKVNSLFVRPIRAY